MSPKLSGEILIPELVSARIGYRFFKGNLIMENTFLYTMPVVFAVLLIYICTAPYRKKKNVLLLTVS